MSIFESTLEKIGRIISRSYGIEVVCQGNMACTDGKRIMLPAIKELDADTKSCMNGFLDHESAHIKFTTFPEIAKCKNEFHKQLLNATEDERIENCMIDELPGTKTHLDYINNKYGSRVRAERKKGKLPWPHRVIMSVRDIMAGAEEMVEDDIKRIVEAVRPLAMKLKGATNTEEVRKITGAITNLVDATKKKEEEEEKKKEEKKKKEKGEKGDKGDKGEESGESDGEMEEEEEDGEGESSGDDRDEDEEGESGDSKGEKSEEESEESDEGEESETDEPSATDEAEEELKAKPLSDITSEFNKDLKKVIAKDKGIGNHHPITTQFDRETNFTGKGSAKRYAALKKEAKPLVGGLRKNLERILKVKENARWQVEQDRGSLDRGRLAKLAGNKNFRNCFKKYSKTETNNVAVQLLIDESGSMAGTRISMARLATIAMAEALNDLQIPFEVTGFTSEGDRRMSAYTDSLRSKGEDVSRFNRRREILVKNIYKDFNSNSLIGIEKLEAICQNPDGEAVRWAGQRLSKQKQNRKVLIVMSDGYPATGEGCGGALNKDLKDAVKDLRKFGIETVGFGIQSDAVKKFYPDHIVVNDISELPTKTMAKLSKIISR